MLKPQAAYVQVIATQFCQLLGSVVFLNTKAEFKKMLLQIFEGGNK